MGADPNSFELCRMKQKSAKLNLSKSMPLTTPCRLKENNESPTMGSSENFGDLS